MIIKIQVPELPIGGPLLIYDKKRELQCTVWRQGNEKGYDRVVKEVKEKGVQGRKAYFMAELRSRDELDVKVAEVLAEQPF
jgi:hypothetical protein